MWRVELGQPPCLISQGLISEAGAERVAKAFAAVPPARSSFFVRPGSRREVGFAASPRGVRLLEVYRPRLVVGKAVMGLIDMEAAK